MSLSGRADLIRKKDEVTPARRDRRVDPAKRAAVICKCCEFISAADTKGVDTRGERERKREKEIEGEGGRGWVPSLDATRCLSERRCVATSDAPLSFRARPTRSSPTTPTLS